MIEEIDAAGNDRLDRLSPGERTRTDESGRAAQTPQGGKAQEVVVSSGLTELIDRVKQAESFRKERVSQVLEKLQLGELVTSETVRGAAERILNEGA